MKTIKVTEMFEISMQMHQSNVISIIRLCEGEPRILAKLAHIICDFKFAKEYGLDRLIYQAYSYKDICDMLDKGDKLPDILDKYKQDSKYLFKWCFENVKLKVDPEPITYADVMTQATKDKDNILKCFFERAFNYPGSEVYCQDILEISNIYSAEFWHNCTCINQMIIDYMYH